MVLFGLVTTVMAGIGLVVILSVPEWSSRAMTLIPYSIVLAAFVSIPVTWLIARRILGAKPEGV
jgi:hypothetical protein